MTPWKNSAIFSHFSCRFCACFGLAEIKHLSPEEKTNLAIFYRAVRNLVDFSLVTKLTKHVSKVRETVRKCEKICEDDILTILMTSHTQKVTPWFLDSNFWAKLQISRPGWSADRSIKILQLPYGNLFLGYHASRREFFWSTYEEKVTFCFFLARREPYKSSDMTSWYPKSAKMTPRGQDFALQYAKYAIFRGFKSGKH